MADTIGDSEPDQDAAIAKAMAAFSKVNSQRGMSDKDLDAIGNSEPDTNPDDDAKAAKKRKKGGKVHGDKPKQRLDKRARGGSGIHIKPSHKGMLHKDLGVKQGEPIPESKLEKAKHSSNPAVKKRAVFAENAKKWHH